MKPSSRVRGVGADARQRDRRPVELQRGAPSGFGRALALLAAVSLSGCAAGQLCPQRHALVTQSAMSCAELNQVTVATVKRMGYNIDTYVAAAHGQPGKVTGTRRDDYDATYTITVDLACSTTEATADAVSTVGCASQISFPNDFQSSFRASMAKKVVQPSLTPKEERTGVNIEVEPLRDGDAAVGAPLSAANLMPVRVSIHNNTARVYRLADGAIALQAQDDKRVDAISAAEAAKRVSRAKPGAAGVSEIEAKALQPVTIEPEAKVGGFIYVPRQAYRRAVVKLIDVEAEEPEGFSIEF